MKRDQQILNTSADILSHVFSDVNSTPRVTKTRRGRASAAGRHLVEQPPPDVVTTPKKTRKDPPLIHFIL